MTTERTRKCTCGRNWIRYSWLAEAVSARPNSHLRSVSAPDSLVGSRHQNPARAGTMDSWHAFHHAFDSQQKCRLR
jgi:hypothetical protein